MQISRSGPLAAWGNAYLTGTVSLDQAVDAVTGRDAAHVVVGLGADDPRDPAAYRGSLRAALLGCRRAGASIRVALPVPGDVRGLPGPATFRTAALEAGEAVLAGRLGLVPDVVDLTPSSAPPQVTWTGYAVEHVSPDLLSIADAQYELTTAIRESARALAAADVAGGSRDVTDPIAAARRAGGGLNLPPLFPQRAVSLLAQAERIRAILELALADPIGGAVDHSGIAARSEALRSLASAVRRARVAGYNAAGPADEDSATRR